MERLTSAERDELLDTFDRDAFHLEQRDWYGVLAEDEPFQRWLAGRPADPRDGLRPWLIRVRNAVRQGKIIRRVRVVTEPLTDYIRWEYECTPQNLAAGEDIRWLPRGRLPRDVVLPPGDFWLFDDRLAAVGYFQRDGRPAGSGLVTDPSAVRGFAEIRDQLWPVAIPHREYRPD
jgi:hypothetical protein